MAGFDAVFYFDVVPVVDTAGAYADGDLLFNPTEMPGFFDPVKICAIIQSLFVHDKSDQTGAMDILFVAAGDSFGTLNAAMAPSDALAANIVGAITVATALFDLGNSRVYQPEFNPLVVRPFTSATTSLWVAGIARAARTMGVASDLVIRVGALR